METSTQLADMDLINNVKEKDCNDSLKELIAKHSGLCGSMFKKFSASSAYFSGVSMSDFLQDKDLLIYQAAKEFDHNRGVKFGTFLGNKVKYHCLKKITHNSKYVSCEDDTIEFMMQDQSKHDFSVRMQEEAAYIMSILEKLKDKRIKQIFKLRYFSPQKKDRGWCAIGGKLHLSYQAVINLHHRALEFLKTKIEQKNCCDLI